MSVTGRGARAKGSRYELEVAREFERHGFPGLRRTPNSGGLHVKGDLRGNEKAIADLAIECKRQERMNLWACLDQTQRQAGPHEIPLLIFRRSLGSSFVCMTLADFLGLLGEARLNPDTGRAIRRAA